MFLAPSCYQISSNECAIASSELPICLITVISWVRIAKNMNMFMFLEQQIFSMRAFDIGKNPQSSCPTNLSRLMYKPTTQYYNCKGYIRPSNCQVDQLPINLLYCPGSLSRWLLSHHKFTFASIGVLAGLHPNMPVFSRRSSVYFLWDRSKPCF